MSESTIPVAVRKIRRLMLLYAAAVLMGSLVFAVGTDFTEKRELFRGLMRVGLFAYLVWWLPTLDKRAWWSSVIACGFLGVVGIVALLLLLTAGAGEGAGMLWTLVTIAVPLYALMHAFTILVQSETRLHFKA